MQHYIQLAYDELCKEDGLTVMSRGLGISLLYTKFIQSYSIKTGEKKLVLCLNVNGIEDYIKDVALGESSSPIELPKVIDNEVNSQERSDMYNSGGCYFITSRILIVDLLDNKIDPQLISGLLIFNAHRISETSIESFVIRVYRERNRNGFVKAFSEDPESLQYSGKLERLMTLLFVKKLFLWPRFRSQVDIYLTQQQPEVIELSQPLTASMQSIQSALLLALKTCLAELKKSAPQLESTTEDAPMLTVENGLFQSFDTIIRSRLDADWHKISWRAKQLVADLATIRKLLDYLIRYDAFSFYYLLLKLQSASSEQISPSLWLTSQAANHIFKEAKERVLKIIPYKETVSSNNNLDDTPESFKLNLHTVLQLDQTIVPVLECPPKWKLLLEIIKEVKSEYRKKLTTITNQINAHNNMGRVLLVVKDNITSSQLRDVIVNGDAFVMDTKYRWFVSQQVADIRKTVVARNRGAITRVGTGSKVRPVGAGSTNEEPELIYQADLDLQQAILNSTTDSSIGDNSNAGGKNDFDLRIPLNDVKSLSVENKLLVVQEKLLRMTPAAAPHQMLATDESNGANMMEAMKASESMTDLTIDNDDDPEDSRISAPVTRKRSINASNSLKSKKKAKVSLVAASNNDNNDSNSSDDEPHLKVCPLDPDLHISIVTHSQAHENFTLLSDYKPSSIILFDPDVAIIRAIEVYQVGCKSEPIKVYSLSYTGSAEEHRYVGSLAKEKKAFENLITIRKHIVISLPDNPADKAAMSTDLRMSMDTRTNFKGRIPVNNDVRQIVVDVREFRCPLPSKLHYSNFALVPRTIYVADFVLAPEICVERKGISDLFQSFASGRLYNQVRSMTKYYKYPCLLIEFSADKSFALIGRDEITPEIQQNSIMSKLTLLTQSFPTLRILWSRSPTTTVEIFKDIVCNHAEVDVLKAVSVGAVGEKDGIDDANGGVEVEAAMTAQEILLTLPGINLHNFREVMNNVENLAELSKLTIAQLSPMIGPVNANKLYTFFKQRRMA